MFGILLSVGLVQVYVRVSFRSLSLYIFRTLLELMVNQLDKCIESLVPFQWKQAIITPVSKCIAEYKVESCLTYICVSQVLDS